MPNENETTDSKRLRLWWLIIALGMTAVYLLGALSTAAKGQTMPKPKVDSTICGTILQVDRALDTSIRIYTVEMAAEDHVRVVRVVKPSPGSSGVYLKKGHFLFEYIKGKFLGVRSVVECKTAPQPSSVRASARVPP